MRRQQESNTGRNCQNWWGKLASKTCASLCSRGAVGATFSPESVWTCPHKEHACRAHKYAGGKFGGSHWPPTKFSLERSWRGIAGCGHKKSARANGHGRLHGQLVLGKKGYWVQYTDYGFGRGTRYRLLLVRTSFLFWVQLYFYWRSTGVLLLGAMVVLCSCQTALPRAQCAKQKNPWRITACQPMNQSL